MQGQHFQKYQKANGAIEFKYTDDKGAKNISKFFSKFDNLIEIQERKLEFLKQRKQSLLQKCLFNKSIKTSH